MEPEARTRKMRDADARRVVDELLEIADPCFAESASDADADQAVVAMTVYVQKLIEHETQAKTEALRDALGAMLQNHHRRFPLNGRCRCDACMVALAIVGGDN